ncbi:DNA-binding protein [Paenibacillus terrae]|uniref:DNA-binding protein n=2 Tax=Paenibacillus terrae TaxID=159743 RepID=A0A0D7WWS8_9BACL|nr:DNA-binding protein [Paenibacillus terrae]
MENYMKKNQLSMSKFGNLAGLNQGTVSTIFSGKQPISIHQLDAITDVLDYPEGYLYEQYIEDHLLGNQLNWRRIHPLLCRSIELDKLNCVEQIILLLMDHLVYSPLLFQIAEESFHTRKYAAAAMLYECVADSEKYQHSERLAMCQYRLFIIGQGDDQLRKYQIASRFETYVDRLNIMDQLDALKDLANTYRSLGRWDKVEEFSQKLEHKAQSQYFRDNQDKKQNSPERPLFFYLAYSKLLRASIFEAKGDYEQALQYTYAYADLSWVKETDEQTVYWMGLFQEWARANVLGNKLLSGDIGILPEYLVYIESNKDELLPILVNIMQAANRFDINVDHILQQFKSEINSYTQQQFSVGTCTVNLILEYVIYLLYELTEYFLNQNKFSRGYDFLISCLEKSASINNKSYIIKCVGLFESFRDMATSETSANYQKIIKGVHANEKKNRIIMLGD